MHTPSTNSSPHESSLGGLFRYFREEAGSTQRDLALVAQVSVRSIRKIETGEECSEKIHGRALLGLNELRLQAGRPPVVLEKQGRHTTIVVCKPTWLQLPGRHWLRSLHGPGALLTADFRVVPFHGMRSLQELDKLVAWCVKPERMGVRIYKGEGGIGKTRLAIELCRRLAALPKGCWTTGFAVLDNFPKASVPWKSLDNLQKPLLVVVDYAGEEEKTRMVSQLLLHAAKCPAPKLRLLFLERDDHWLDRLHENPAAREILHGPLLSRAGNEDVHSLPPVANTSTERAESLRFAIRTFAGKLSLKTPPMPEVDLKARFYESVLFLHMRALLTLFGGEARTKDAILRQMLARERDYWKKRLTAVGLSPSLLPVVEAAVARISEQNGVSDRKNGLKLFSKITLCRDQSEVVREQLFRVLRECYPAGPSGIGPLQPDELKLFLISRFIDEP